MRLVIADDEAPLRAWLRRLIAEVAPAADVVGEAADGHDALRMIEEFAPDAALLDIRMPGLSGLDVAARAARTRADCRIVFVTAHDAFAVQAFEQAAVDYLLKPVTAERLAKAMQRLAQPAAGDAARLERLLARLAPAPAPAPLRWLRVSEGEAVRLIDVMEVDRFEAADKYTVVHADGRQWLLRTALRELEGQLDPQAFWRIHRGTLVRVAAIGAARRDLMGRLWVELKRGGPPLAVSRTYAHLFSPNRMSASD